MIYPGEGAGRVTLVPNLSLQNTLLVSSLSNKLLSVGQMTEDLNCCALIYPKFCLFQDIPTKEIIGRGTKRGGLYYMDEYNCGLTNAAQGMSNKEKQIWLWHRRLGHSSFPYLRRLLPSLFLNLDETKFKCEDCILAKSHRVSYSISLNKCEIPFMLIHSDVWGPTPILVSSGIRWFMTFLDDCTCMTWLYLMKGKDEVFRIFRSFHNMIRT